MKLRARLILGLMLFVWGSACTAVKKGYERAQSSGDEQILRTDLSGIRAVIQEYAADKGEPPKELTDLVNAGYIRQIPADPMTNKTDWIITQFDCPALVKCKKGIKDIHSASTAKSSTGDSYAEW